MKKTLEIRRNLKYREHIKELVRNLKNDLKETEILILRYEKTVKKLNYDLFIWDEFSKEIKS